MLRPLKHCMYFSAGSVVDDDEHYLFMCKTEAVFFFFCEQRKRSDVPEINW